VHLLYISEWGMGDGRRRSCLVRMEWRPSGWSVCLPLLIFPCSIKSRSFLLPPAHPGGPGKRAVKRLCVFFALSNYVNFTFDVLVSNQMDWDTMND